MKSVFEICLLIIMIIMLVVFVSSIFFLLLKNYDVTDEIKSDIARCQHSDFDIKRTSIGYRFVKRFFDIQLSLFGIILSIPFIFISALILKMQGVVTVFWIKYIVGYKNKKAKEYRLTTLVSDDGIKYRRTPFGKFVYRSCIDNLPIYFSVFLGYLTVIGLESISYDELNENNVDEYNYFRPGIISLSKVVHSEANKQIFNRVYCKNAGIKYDLKILFYALKNVYVR